MFYDDIEVCKGESNFGDDSWARQRTRCMAPKDSVGSSRHQVIGGFLMQQVKIHSHLLYCRMIRIKEAFWERVFSVCYECGVRVCESAYIVTIVVHSAKARSVVNLTAASILL